MEPLYIILFAFIGLTQGSCHNNVLNKCTLPSASLENCNANFSAAHHVIGDLQKYAIQHISHSFQYLLMSTNFANYEKSRDGFAKLYRKLSDKTWDDAIELVKYITKRGGTMEFNIEPPTEEQESNYNYNMNEIESLSRALDMHKTLATEAHRIHSEVTKRGKDYHDAETLSYIEKEFVHGHADIIRNLAGYTNDLSKMIEVDDPSLSVYLFDEYLQQHI